MHERCVSDGAPFPDFDSVCLKDALFERVTMQRAKLIQVCVVTDLKQALVNECAPIIEDLLADPRAKQPGNDVLERRTREEQRDRRTRKFPYRS